MNERLSGGCQVPIAGHATLDGERLTINGLVGEPDGSNIVRASRTGPATDAAALGIAVAEELLAGGADAILKRLYAEQQS
jgi:hydroxymethylbilane synthase